jgi:hypothetical protein
VSSSDLGDRAAERCWSRAVYLLDYAYVTCPDRATGRMRIREGFTSMCAPATRRLPLYLDSGAWRIARGTAPKWAGYRRYRDAIDVLRPDGVMAMDVLHDQAASRAGYDRMRADGYGDLVIPVWHARPAWIDGLSVRANARLAARDPTLRSYADRSPLVAIGGLAHGPCPREQRHVYLAELCRAFPALRLWGLGQASRPVVNGLGMLGLLDRVSVDGSWWIHDARTGRLAILQDGLIRSVTLTHRDAATFFTMVERMAANLRSLLSAYAGLWVFPAPSRVPTEVHDEEVRLELRRRLDAVQLDLFDRLAVS